MFAFDSPPPPMPLTHNPACIVVAAARYRLPPEVLLLIRMSERGKPRRGDIPGTESVNSNKTIDYGANQINTVNLSRFHKMGVTTEQIRDDECVNTYAAAYLLKSHYIATNNAWHAMMRYHSGTPRYQLRYLDGLVRNLKTLNAGYTDYARWLRRQTLRLVAMQDGAPEQEKVVTTVHPPHFSEASAAVPAATPVRVAGSGILRR